MARDRADPAAGVDTCPDVNVEAAEIMGGVHAALLGIGCEHSMCATALVRIAVCLFAQDAGIVERSAFRRLIDATPEDGDLDGAMTSLLAPPRGEQDSDGAERSGLPRFAGELLDAPARPLPTSGPLRAILLRACELDWSQLSPVIFGSLLQRAMSDDTRHGDGVHYTTEDHILAVLDPLFVDELRIDLTRAGHHEHRLRALHARIARLQIFDPSCGCGAFLVIAYRCLKQIEQQILEALVATGQDVTELDPGVRVTLAQCHGIEVQGLAAQVARVSLWIVDHQLRQSTGRLFDPRFTCDPQSATPNIVHGNALTLPWREVAPAGDWTRVVGNPPYGGKKEQTPAQKADMARVWGDVPNHGKLDLASAWFRLAADFMATTGARCGFVSTNSITQGEQAAVLWRDLRLRCGVHIAFARRAFPWRSNGSRGAHVHVVIIGMSHRNPATRWLFEGTAVREVKHINPYLLDAPDAFVGGRRRPLSDVPPMAYGSMMIDRGRGSDPNAGLLVDSDARQALLEQSPALAPHIRCFLGGEEFLSGTRRYCLWLVDAPEQLVACNPEIVRRLAAIRAFRSRSSRPQTRRLAATPTLFGEIRQPSTAYLLVPKVSSETRPYVPIGFVEPEVIASGSALTVADATPYHFGVLSSAMHDAWLRAVAGRMRSDLQYSASIVYNNFPWPTAPSELQRSRVADAALAVLAARQQVPQRPLGQLYRAHAMPTPLRNAHRALDAEVDRCYRATGFANRAARQAYLFDAHARLSFLDRSGRRPGLRQATAAGASSRA